MLCYTVFFSSIGIEHIAQAAIDYSSLTRSNWGAVNTDIHYRYDDNGSLTEKITANKDEADPDNNFIEKTVYEYNLQNRLSLVKTTTDGVNWDITTYKYNDDGIRVEKDDNGTITTYLIDSHNHTGYSQVLEEWDTTSTPTLTKTYIIGDDVIGQADNTGTITYLLYDGQGSVRHHSDSSGNLVSYSGCDTFAYDAYGHRVDPLRDTVNDGLFYTGEMYDSESSQYYLRARWYNPLNGLFNRMDPYPGNNYDPQSLHKYLYCHNNPVNAIDPSGMFEFSAIGQTIVAGIQSIITAVSTAFMWTYMWAATHMALITTVSYYAMWTFIASSIWVAAENQGYVPEITIFGDWTVAKAVQVISGAVFFLGLMIINSVPNLDRGPLVKQVQTRVYELRQGMGGSDRFGTTMSVGIAEKSGQRVTLIATSEEGLYLRPGVTLRSNEILVGGTGHAEQRIVDFCRAQNMRLLTIGATRPVCTGSCVPAVTPTGADIATPIKGEDVTRY